MRRLIPLLSLLLAAPGFAQPLRVLAYDTDPFFTRASGEPTGLEYEILEYFARTSGRPLQIRWVDSFEDVLPMLRRGEGDIAAATITITPEREATVDFSSSYFPVRVMLVEPRKRNTQNLESLRGSTLATMKGTTYQRLLSRVPESDFVYADSEKALFDLVAAGEAAALAVDSAVALTLLPDYPGLHMTLPLSEEQNYGFAVRSGSPLAAELSKHLAQLKMSKIYFRLLERHFGEEAVETVMAAKNDG